MSTNFISGLASGLDTTALIDAIITSRSRPVVLLERRQTEKTAQLAAWQSFEATLISLKVESDRLADTSLWNEPLATTSNEDALSVSADSSAALGTYSFFVKSLATSEQQQSQAYASKETEVGSGTLKIVSGSDTTILEVDAGTTLEGLVDLVNESDAGVSASILKSTDNGVESYYFVLTADETGEAASFTASATLSGGTAPSFTSIRAGADAEIEFGGEGGLTLSSATNTFTDVVDGVDVTALQAQTAGDPPVTVTVARDTEKLKGAMEDFVTAYNTAIEFANAQFDFNPTVGSRPPLMGDATLIGIMGQVRSLATRPVTGLPDTAAFRSVFAVGLKSGTGGALTLDSAKFDEALATDFDAVADLFRASASFDAPGVRMLSAPNSTELGDVEAEIAITQAAAKAQIVGDPISFGGPGIKIKANNEAFRIEIDGVLSEELKVAQGTYGDGESLVAAIQAAIDGSVDLGSLGVSVTFDDLGGGAGTISLTSTRYGSAGTIQLQSVQNFDQTLGFDNVVDTVVAGEDVAGTINGVAASGNGRILTGAEDSDFDGLSLLVTLTAGEAPATISSTFSDGIGRTASRALLSLTDGVDGTLVRVEDAIQRRIDLINADIERKLEALERRRVRLQQRFTRMESVLGELQNQGAFINAQLSANISSGGFGSNRG